MSKKVTQNTKAEEVKEEVQGTAIDTELVDEAVVEPVEKVPFWKRPKVQKVGKIAAIIAAIGGAAVAGVMLGKKTGSDDDGLTEGEYIEKLHDIIDGDDYDSFQPELTAVSDSEKDMTQ